MNLGVPEILLILVIALLFFGPSRLPSLGKSLGEAIRGFKKGLSEAEPDVSDRNKQSQADKLDEPQKRTSYQTETEKDSKKS